MRLLAILALLLASPALAQQTEPQLKQLEIEGTRGYAVIVDTDGHEHYCDARVTSEAVDLGPCKPLRLVTPLINAKPTIAAPKTSAQTAADHTRAQVVGLFENNGCSLKYTELKTVLGKLGARQREVVGATIASMSKSGEIADDLRNERVTLKAAGSRCR